VYWRIDEKISFLTPEKSSLFDTKTINLPYLIPISSFVAYLRHFLVLAALNPRQKDHLAPPMYFFRHDVLRHIANK
jgi:hypothetical protein